MKKISIIFGILSVLALGAVSVNAQTAPQETKIDAQADKPVNVGNKICPVSGERVGQGGMKPETYEYKGKIYNFCCAMCIDTFKSNPEKYIKKVEEELKSQLKEENTNTTNESSKTMHEGMSH